MATAKPVLVAVTSDIHVNSTVAMCPPEGVVLDDGGRYKPSRAQSWLWQCWEDYWAAVKARRAKAKAELWCVYNGDLFDGLTHHRTTQVISSHPEPSAYLAERVYGVPLALRPDRTFIVRGTEAHVGPSGASEEAFARSIRAEKCEATGRWSWWELLLDPHGVRLDFRHHGRMGQRPWTKQNVVNNLAAQIFYEHAARGEPHPQLAFRSHYHQYVDTGDAHPTRVIQTASFQLKTAYVHKVAAENIADVGGHMVLIQPDGTFEVTKHLYQPELVKPWQSAA